MQYRLLAIDIDGTLVDSRDQLSEETKAALAAARQAGIEVVLATGRRYARALPLVQALGLNVPLISASGALVKRPMDHVTLHCARFEGDSLHRMLGEVAAAGYEAVLYADTYHEGFDYYCVNVEPTQRELAEYFRKNPQRERICPDLMTCPPPGIFAGFAMGTRPEMARLAEHLHQQLPGAIETHVLRSPMYSGFMCELLPAGTSKWSAISNLASEWGIDAAEICAVGDDVNDIPMLLGSGLGVAMGNACDEVKAAADRVTLCHDQHGVAEVVRWLLGD